MCGGIFLWEKFGSLRKAFTQTTVVTQNIVLKEITTMGKLELVNYQFKDVVESEIKKTLFPDAKALLIVSGQAIGCIDLTKVKETDINQQGDSVFVRLPKAELCVSKVNHTESRVYDTNMFAVMDEAELVDEAYKQAEEQIKESALEQGILEQSQTQAQKMLGPVLEKISGKKVKIFF
jgi:ABC-type phosphate transport system auxiliary subunit